MRVLLLTYVFSPANVIGSKRWSDFYNLSSEDNHLEIDVLTANWKGTKVQHYNVNYLGDVQDFKRPISFQKTLNIKNTIRHPSFFIRSINKSIFSPWINACKKWIDEHQGIKYDFIIASYGPLSNIVVGNYAKKKLNTTFILDLRDLISIQGQKIKLPIIHFFDKKIDRFLTKKVDAFIAVSPTSQKKAINFYGRKVKLIFNGFYSPINRENSDLTIKNKKNLNIIYTGTLGIKRNPKFIIQLLNEFVKLNGSTKIVVSFASQDNPFDFVSQEDHSAINLKWLGYLSREQLDKEKRKSNIFLLIEDLTLNGNENLTGKIFEYLNSEKPILVSCNPKSDIATVLKETNSGSIVSSQKELYEFINANRFRNNRNTLKYSRLSQYNELKNFLMNLKET